jgi:hypothetical protein
MTKLKKLALILVFLWLLAEPVVSEKEMANSTSTKNLSENVGDHLNDSMLNIAIDTPHENESVDSTLVVKGRLSEDLEKDEHLWIAVKPYKSINYWWPQSGGPIEPVNRIFEGNAFLSGENGDKFEIGIIVVGDDLNEKIMDWENVSRQLNRWNSINDRYAGKPDKSSGKFPIVPKEEIESLKYANVTVILAPNMESLVDIQVIDSQGKPVEGAIVEVMKNNTIDDRGVTNSQGKYLTYLTSGKLYNISTQINDTSSAIQSVVAGTKDRIKFENFQQIE